MLAHPRFGPRLRRWHDGRLMRRRAKSAALGGISISFAASWALLGNAVPLAVVAASLSLLVVYLATRPEPPAAPGSR